MLNPLIMAGAIEALGELSQTAANVAQLTAITATAINVFKARIDDKLADAGVQVKQLTIEAIDSL